MLSLAHVWPVAVYFVCAAEKIARDRYWRTKSWKSAGGVLVKFRRTGTERIQTACRNSHLWYACCDGRDDILALTKSCPLEPECRCLRGAWRRISRALNSPQDERFDWCFTGSGGPPCMESRPG